MRMHGHGAHDDMSYVPEGCLEEWRGATRSSATRSGSSTSTGSPQDEIEALRAEVEADVDECAEKALASPMPDPAIAARGCSPSDWEPLGDGQAPWSRWSERPADGGGAP